MLILIQIIYFDYNRQCFHSSCKLFLFFRVTFKKNYFYYKKKRKLKRWLTNRLFTSTFKVTKIQYVSVGEVTYKLYVFSILDKLIATLLLVEKL